MEDILSGSKEDNQGRITGPLDDAKESALRFIFGMQTLSTFKTISDRIQLIEAMMELPLLQSGSTRQSVKAMEQYESEMRELETAIIVFCALPDAAEA